MNPQAYAFFEKVSKIPMLLPLVIISSAFIIGAVAVRDDNITLNVMRGVFDISTLTERYMAATLSEYWLIIAVCSALMTAMVTLIPIILVSRWVITNRGVSLE